jgi:hypothetical protein
MGQTPMHYARNVFGGEEDIYTNNEYYYMISIDDIKYIDVIKKRFTNKAIPYNVISVTDYYTESDPFKAYDKLILQKWDDWKFSVFPGKCKISTELAINKEMTCKYTSDVKFFIKKLEERIDIDFNFLYLCLLKLIKCKYNWSSEFDNFKKLETLVKFYLDQKFKNSDKIKKEEILNKFEDLFNNFKTILINNNKSYRRYSRSSTSSRTRRIREFEEDDEEDERRRQWEDEERKREEDEEEEEMMRREEERNSHNEDEDY